MAIKVGDKVKATLKDTTVVGEVLNGLETGRPYFEVQVTPNGPVDIALWLGDGWKIEVIHDLPTKVGAIIRNNQDGALYVRHTDEVGIDYPWTEFQSADADRVWGDDTVAEGGFEILFGGVDE